MVSSGVQSCELECPTERPIQRLYPLELSCDMTVGAPIRNRDPKAPVYRPTCTRDVAVAAKVRIQDQADDEEKS